MSEGKQSTLVAELIHNITHLWDCQGAAKNQSITLTREAEHELVNSILIAPGGISWEPAAIPEENPIPVLQIDGYTINIISRDSPTPLWHQ